MQIKEANYLTSAARKEQFLCPEKPLIAFCGKSNSGKSSLINLLANQKNLAKTSAAPGRTRLINYFDFGEFLLADLPGYGYAEAPQREKERWAVLLKAFLLSGTLSHVFLLTDIRRDPSKDDLLMVEFFNFHILPFTVIATKCDKISKMSQKTRLQSIAKGFGLGVQNLIPISSVTSFGKDALLQKIASLL